MKLLLIFFNAMFALALGSVVNVEFKRTAKRGTKNRFEALLGLDAKSPQKRDSVLIDGCQSGYVASKYCTIPAENCFGSGQNKWVNFSPAFQAKPSVVIGLTLVDTHKDQNVRVRAEVTQVTTTGFNIKFKPWHDSITYQIGVNWMACS